MAKQEIEDYEVEYHPPHGWVAYRTVYGFGFKSAVFENECHNSSGEAVAACRKKIRAWVQRIVDTLDAEETHAP